MHVKRSLWHFKSHISQVKSLVPGKKETLQLERSTPGATDPSASPLFQEDHERDALRSCAKAQGGQGGNLKASMASRRASPASLN